MLVRFFAGAADAAGQEEREVPDGLTAEELVDLLAAGNDRLAQVLAVSSFLADGVRVTGMASLAGVSQVDVLPPFAGG